MSPSLLARLQRIARQTQRDVQADNRMRAEVRRNTGRKTNVTDYYRPLELMARCPWTRPS